MAMPEAATSPLPDDPALLRIEGPIATITLNRPVAFNADNIAPVVGELLKHYHPFIETVRRMPKIVLSSVHGSAAGAGMGLAFVADLCIAADDARFPPAYAKIGV